MRSASPALASRWQVVEQDSYPLLCGGQLTLGPMELVLQLLEFRPHVLLRRGRLRVTHVRAAVGTDVYESLLLKEPERSANSVAGYAVCFLKLPVGRELAAGQVPALLDFRPDDARHVPAINALVVCCRHGAMVPGWLTPKLLTNPLSHHYCRKTVDWLMPDHHQAGAVPGLQPPPGAAPNTGGSVDH